LLISNSEVTAKSHFLAVFFGFLRCSAGISVVVCVSLFLFPSFPILPFSPSDFAFFAMYKYLFSYVKYIMNLYGHVFHILFGADLFLLFKVCMLHGIMYFEAMYVSMSLIVGQRRFCCCEARIDLL
jgi:hypothetical protein